MSSKVVLRCLHNGEVISGGLKQRRVQSPKAVPLLQFHRLSVSVKYQIKLSYRNKERNPGTTDITGK